MAAQGLDDSAEVVEIQLISSDFEKLTLPKTIAIQSELIKTTAENDPHAQEIQLPNVRGSILRKVTDYLKHHDGSPAKKIERPLKSSDLTGVLSQWDADFIDIDQELLFELILAANFMDIKPLLDLACCKVASMIRGKSPEQIRQTFNIINDFTPEEEAKIIAENKWAEEA